MIQVQQGGELSRRGPSIAPSKSILSHAGFDSQLENGVQTGTFNYVRIDVHRWICNIGPLKVNIFVVCSEISVCAFPRRIGR